MEQLLKLNRRLFLTFVTVFLFLFISCQTKKDLPKSKYKTTIISDTIKVNGSLIFDSKDGLAYFLENTTLVPKSKHQIKNQIKEANYHVLLRRGLNTYTTSNYLNLTLCNSDKRLKVNLKELFFNRYAIIKLNDFTFYKVDGKYEDSKERLIICNGE